MRIKLSNNQTFELERYFEMKNNGTRELLLELKNTTYDNIILNFIAENLRNIEIEQPNEVGEVEKTQEFIKVVGFFNYEKLVSVTNNIDKNTFEVIVSEPTIQNNVDKISEEINSPLGLEKRTAELEKTVLQLMMMKEV